MAKRNKMSEASNPDFFFQITLVYGLDFLQVVVTDDKEE